ncbi:MAG TPA: UDPGP type 1 family protein [Gemmataceae bacterium]|jgi:UDP-N-acetylglucosamine/UDP-N-acetylgalactosamine diphosphorylase
MHQPPDDLKARLAAHRQEHALAGWDRLGPEDRAHLVGQLQTLDLDLLARLYARRDEAFAVPALDRIAPLPNVLPDAPDPEARQIGDDALASGEVAALVVAGGQGTRLGFDHPKGMFAIGPVSNASLFQLHAEKVLARGRKYGVRIPFLVMTSHATHAETEAFFQEHDYFGLSPDDVYFFRQGTMPALDLATGRLLMEGPGQLFTSPNGHGGTLTAMADTGLLDQLRHRGVRHVFYFQVDNPLVKIADPTFLGRHVRARADVSSKVIPKDGPFDKLGNLALIDGKLSIIEYSDLPKELAEARDAAGGLRFNVGNPAIHIFDLAFLERVTAGDAGGLPYHLARKKVPYWDPAADRVVTPEKENALKFERFVFDVLPLVDRWTAVATSRPTEFAPLKNATGADSPASVKAALTALATDWLRRAGAEVPAGAVVEISPLFALEPDDVAGKVKPGTALAPGTYLKDNPG